MRCSPQRADERNHHAEHEVYNYKKPNFVSFVNTWLESFRRMRTAVNLHKLRKL